MESNSAFTRMRGSRKAGLSGTQADADDAACQMKLSDQETIAHRYARTTFSERVSPQPLPGQAELPSDSGGLVDIHVIHRYLPHRLGLVNAFRNPGSGSQVKRTSRVGS